MEFTLESALQMVDERQKKGHQMFYRALPKEASEIVRSHYRGLLRQMSMSEYGCNDAVTIKNDCGTTIATGYKRVVVGDYGAYVEFTKDQLVKESISPKWPGTQNKDASYIWHETTDASKTKVYLQQHKVQYADYRIGMYYAAPDDVFIDQVFDAESREWREFTRVSHQQHMLEAKRSVGGEVVGNPINKIFTKENQWLCRNPDNGHTWTCNDNDFWILYRLVTDDGTSTKHQKDSRKRRSTQGRKKLNEAAAETTQEDCGPLFGTAQ